MPLHNAKSSASPTSPRAANNDITDRMRFLMAGYVMLTQAEKDGLTKYMQKYEFKLYSEKQNIIQRLQRWVKLQTSGTQSDKCPCCNR